MRKKAAPRGRHVALVQNESLYILAGYRLAPQQFLQTDSQALWDVFVHGFNHDFFHILATKPQHGDMCYVLTFSSTLFFAFTSGKYSTAKLQLPTEVWLLHVQTAVTAASVNSKGLCWHYFLISWSVPRINILHKEHLSWPDWIQSEVLINALSGYGTYRTFTASLEILGQPRFFINEIHLYAT